MEKIININFQGRVIPIEETAYNSLKQYTDSLRNHFAGEESSDEIINDIENRIAELLSDRLKRGSPCIVSSDVNTVINSIGRLEDIEAAEGEENKPPKHATAQPQNFAAPAGRFYRNADDKIIAGVCSGIANRTGMDPVIVRILFVLLLGAFFWVYIILWVIVPSQSVRSNITRRLYRNPADKVIAGVCGGLAVYFRTSSWVPRLIFLLPLLLVIFSHNLFGFLWHWQFGFGPRIFTGSFGGSLFILYIILWVALPYASSATDMMEMRGEKIDLNSIKAASQAKAGYAVTPPRRAGGGIGRVIGILFKAFFLLIAGSIALSLFGVLIGLGFTGFVAVPFTGFILDGWEQHLLAWCGLVLFFGIPFLALITWLIRRLVGVRSHRHYLGYVFSGLWLMGLVCIVMLAGLFMRNFGAKSMVEDTYSLQQPSAGKLYVNVSSKLGLDLNGNHSRWFQSWDNDGSPFRIVSKDSLWLNTVKVKVAESDDSLFHIYETRISRGETSEDAKNLAGHITFGISQQDSIISLPSGFTISNKDKFRNQQVLVIVEVPVGKEIEFGKGVKGYNWFNININGQRDFHVERHWENANNYHSSGKYIMTPSGLKSTGAKVVVNTDDEDEDDED
jgi:phage shock protein PspC (stress-responsive transcriptional regulator)